MDQLPLFPLRTVLFPGVALPIHVFEERYKRMIGQCIEERTPFGVVLIRSGPEVGGLAEPHEMGTTAYITHVQRLDDGRMNLIALGYLRFRIHSLDTSAPYLVADVTFPDQLDADTPAARDGADRVAALFAEQLRLTMALSGQWTRRVDLPDEPAALADFVAGQTDWPTDVKQDLLETLSVPERLAKEETLLGERIRTLTERWEEEQRKRLQARRN